MAALTGVVATAHSPGLTGFPERADPARRASVMAVLRGAIEATGKSTAGSVVVLATGGLSHWVGMPSAAP